MSRLWRLQTTVMPKCLLMCSSASITTLELRGSSEAMGSSARMMSGSCTRARAMPRCGGPTGQARHVEAFQRRQGLRLLGVVPQLQECARGRNMEGAAHHDVVQHVEPAGEVELLEDHGAGRPPLAPRAG